MQTVALPPGWEHHAAPVATLLEGCGPPILWWASAVLLLAAALLLLEKRPGLSTILAVLSALVLGIACNGLVDDAYIQFRYAANLAAGHGPVFNAGERLEGASGGIWIGAVALASALTGRDAGSCARTLSIVFAGFAAAAAAALGHAIEGRRGAGLAAIVWAALPTPALYAATGLETAAFAFALLGVGAAVARGRRGPATLAGALAATLRPEGIVLALGAAPFWKRLGRAGRFALGGGVLAAAVIAAARLSYYGQPVPRPVLVKGVIAAAGAGAGLRYLGQAAFEWWPLLPAALWIAPRFRVLLPALAPATLWIGVVLARGGDWMPGGRYLLPLLVIVAFAAAMAAARLPGRAALWLAIAPVAWGLVLLMPHEQPLDQTSYVPAGRAWRAMAEHRVQSRWWEGLGTWVRRSVPPGTFLATGPSGALPYAARLRTFDLYGLCSQVTQPREGEAGHRLWGLKDAVAAGVDVIYPGQGLLMVESEEAVLASARLHFADTPGVLERYRPVAISHAPEYHLDFLRDVLWVRPDLLEAVPRAEPGRAGG